MICGWTPLDAVAPAGRERARWVARITRGETPARLDVDSGAVVVWAPLDAPRLEALLEAGLHARLGRTVDVRDALPALCERLAAARPPRKHTIRFPAPAAARRRAA